VEPSGSGDRHLPRGEVSVCHSFLGRGDSARSGVMAHGGSMVSRFRREFGGRMLLALSGCGAVGARERSRYAEFCVRECVASATNLYDQLLVRHDRTSTMTCRSAVTLDALPKPAGTTQKETKTGVLAAPLISLRIDSPSRRCGAEVIAVCGRSVLLLGTWPTPVVVPARRRCAELHQFSGNTHRTHRLPVPLDPPRGRCR
jgi:hypothetical protein